MRCLLLCANASWSALPVAAVSLLVERDETLMSDFEELKVEEKLFTVSVKNNGEELWFDRDPRHFRPVLNYLRTGELIRDSNVSLEGIMFEASYFQVKGLMDQVVRENEDLKDARENINAFID
jgi:BTB/POZ domain